MGAETPALGRLRLFIALSGVAGLVYQSLWVRQLSLVLGSTTHATGTVLAAFMGGLGVGALALGRRADRSPAPLRLYAQLELAIGLFGLLSIPALAQSGALYAVSYEALHDRPAVLTLARFAIGFAFVAAPAFLMGGTLPVAIRYVVRRPEQVGRGIAELYVLNTLGAAVGALLLPFVLLPALGVRQTLVLTGTTNVAIALAAWAAARREGDVPPHAAVATAGPWRADLLGAFFVSGFVALALEVVWNRFFTIYVGSSIYSYAIILSLYLVGIVLGGLVFTRLDRRGRDPAAIFHASLLLLLVDLAATVPFMDRTAYLQLAALDALGLGFASYQLATVLAACLVVLPPTVLFGVAFPAVAKALSPDATRVGAGLGLAYLVNTAGTTAGALAASFVLLPWLGLRGSLDALVVLAAAALALATARAASARRLLAVATVVVAALGASRLLAPAWDARLMHLSISKQPELALGIWRKGRIPQALADVNVLELRDGVDATVSVVESAHGARVLYMNGKADAGDREDMTTQTVLGHLPLLVRPDARRALVIGMGSGVTAAAVARHPVEWIDLLEISPEVLELGGRWFERVNRDVVRDPRVHVRVEDGRNFAAFHPAEPYDVIVSQPSNPWMTGVANLFTDEFFAQVRRRLRPGGVLAQWFQSYNMRTDDVRVLVGTLRRRFPHVYVFAFNPAHLRGDMIALASAEPLDFTNALTTLAGDEAVGVELRALGIGPTEMLQGFVLSSENVDAFVGGAAVNSDDRPLIELRAPRAIFDDTVAGNLEALHRASRGARLPATGAEAFADAFGVRAPPGFHRTGSAYRNALAPAASPGARPLRELLMEVDFEDGGRGRLAVVGVRGRVERAAFARLAADAAGRTLAEDGEAIVAGHAAVTYAAGDGTRAAAWTCGPSGTSFAAALAPAEHGGTPAADVLRGVACH